MPPVKGLRVRTLREATAAGQPPLEGYDACVIGAGAAGSFAAHALASRGMRVALCEAGVARCGPSVADCFDASFPESVYSGARDGRAFGFGGSTSRWGALLIPHSATDAPAPGRAGEDWRGIVGEIGRNAPAALRRLRWGGTTDFTQLWMQPGELARRSGVSAAGFVPMEGLYLPFRRKNLAWLFEQGSTSGSIEVLSGAVAARWIVRQGDPPVVEAIEVRSPEGASAIIRAKRFIVAAGALESTRLVLDLSDTLPSGALPGAAALGRGLGDHLSISIGDFEGDALAEARALFAPSFARGWMRCKRLHLERAADEPRGFVHPIFDDRSVAFAVAKECLQALQARRLPRLRAGDAFAATAGAARMAFARYARQRLHLDRSCQAHLQLDLEQRPSDENRIELAPEHSGVDAVGRRRLSIRWAIRPADLACIESVRAQALDRWSRASGLPPVEPRKIDLGATKPHDAYHPVGTLRLGSDDGAVVDPTLALRGVEGVWVVSTAVFPSAGTANPTFSMLCLAEGLCGRLSDRRDR